MELRLYFELFWQRLWLILLGIIVAGGVAYVISRNTPPTYRASAHLLINLAPDTAANEARLMQIGARLATTYQELIQKRPVLEETIRRLDLPYTPQQLQQRLTVSSPQDSQLLIVNIEDKDPEQAALIANTLVEVFTDQTQAIQTIRYGEAIANWELALQEAAELVESLQTELEALDELDGSASASQEALISFQLTQARTNYGDIVRQLQTLRIAQMRETDNIIVVESAVPNDRPVRPRVMNNTLLAAIVGGMLALGVVFLVDYLDDTVKTPEQVTQLTQLPTLGAIASSSVEKGGDIELITQRLPRSPISEAYRSIRTNLSFAAIDEGLHSLVITSAFPSEGKSTTATNLAIVMAQAAGNVILVDADLRRPRQHQSFQVANNQGLTRALLDSASPVTTYLQETAVPGLRLLTSGAPPPNPAELLNSQRMRHLIAELEAEATIVIFDAPPLLSVTDAAILGGYLDGVLLVMNTDKTREGALLQALENLLKTNSTVLGVVMNRAPVGRVGYYYYQYSDYQETAESGQRRRLAHRWLPDWLGRSQ